MQKKYKENYLKPYAVKSIISKGRIYKEPENSIRAPYQRIYQNDCPYAKLRES